MAWVREGERMCSRVLGSTSDGWPPRSRMRFRVEARLGRCLGVEKW